jgi:hypothetical protein
LARNVTFLKSQREVPSDEISVLVQIVGRDIRTTTGNNIHLPSDLAGLDPLARNSRDVKKAGRGARAEQVDTTLPGQAIGAETITPPSNDGYI